MASVSSVHRVNLHPVAASSLIEETLQIIAACKQFSSAQNLLAITADVLTYPPKGYLAGTVDLDACQGHFARIVQAFALTCNDFWAHRA
jgi:hypothetical protein